MLDLLNLRITSRQVCRGYLRKSRRPLVRLSQMGHISAYAPTGAGKGQGLIVPFLATHSGSIVTVDLKGENTQLTAALRARRFGHRCVLLDPYRVATDQPDALNPLDLISADDPLALDLCDALANSLVIREPQEMQPHFNDSAQSWIAAVVAMIVRYGTPGKSRSLQTVRDILANDQMLNSAIEVMCASDAWGGLLARRGHQLQQFIGKERSSVLTTVSRHLQFLDTPAIAESTRTSSFSPLELLGGKLSIYLILPLEVFQAKAAAMRLWLGCLMQACLKGGLQEQQLVHFIIDEASALSHRFTVLNEALVRFRGFGVRVHLYYQCPSQLKKCFPDGDEAAVLSNTTQVYFGLNTTEGCEALSNRLGEETIVVNSGGDGRSYSRQLSQSPGNQQSSNTYSTSENSNWQAHGRRLLTAAEIATLPARCAITLVPGLPPIMTQLVHFYQQPKVGRRPGVIRRAAEVIYILAASLVCCGAALGMAWALTELISREGPASLGRILLER
jgi:type IV secretion system protein VirD4